MSREERLAIFPTRGALVSLKSRMLAASKGHLLLKRKSDALQFRYRTIFAELTSLKISLEQAVQDAMFSLAKMRFVTGEMIIPMIIETVNNKASTKVLSHEENYAGVNYTVFKISNDGNDVYKFAGLSRGGQQLSAVKKNYYNLIKRIIEISSLQSIFVKFDDVLKLTNRRISGIENIIIPKYVKTLSYLESELEEFDREDFYRIKKIKDKKLNKTNSTIQKNDLITLTKCCCAPHHK